MNKYVAVYKNLTNINRKIYIVATDADDFEQVKRAAQAICPENYEVEDISWIDEYAIEHKGWAFVSNL